MNYKNLTLITIIAIVIFLLFPNLDIATSSLFYKQGEGFIYSHVIFSRAIYDSVRVITIIIVLASLLVLLNEAIKNKSPNFSQKFLQPIIKKIPFSKKQIYFLFLVLIITPGIIVHGVIKPEWERARPRQIIEFGGDKQFSSFYHINSNQDGKSFASGHAATGFSLVALAYMFAAKYRRRVFVATLTYAIIVALCRVWQGGHFLSDVTFSGILTLWTIYLLRIFYLEKNKDKSSEENLDANRTQ